jgi:hypothetical protein
MPNTGRASFGFLVDVVSLSAFPSRAGDDIRASQCANVLGQRGPRRGGPRTREFVMKIVVIGGNGLIGTNLVNRLRQRGHEVVAASPSSGVNTITGEGLAQALAGAQRGRADYAALIRPMRYA